MIAVVEQHKSQLDERAPSFLEEAYLATAAQLAVMISVGAFPLPDDVTNLAFNPRVGDGFIRIDAAGDVQYASPNALSAYRRLGLIGDLVDENLPSLTAELFPAGPGPVDDSVAVGRCPAAIARRTELVSGDAHLMVRVLPLGPAGSGWGRSCSAATSATCAARNACWSPRTRPSGRSTTG